MVNLHNEEKKNEKQIQAFIALKRVKFLVNSKPCNAIEIDREEKKNENSANKPCKANINFKSTFTLHFQIEREKERNRVKFLRQRRMKREC